MLKLSKSYINKMFECSNEMKVFLLDKNTTKIISLIVTMMKAIEQDIYLIQSIENAREFMPFMKCILFVHPSSMEYVLKELRDPRYGEYYLFFSDMLNFEMIEQIAESDTQEVVRKVEEIFLDYFVTNDFTFHLNIPSVLHTENKAYQEMQSKIISSLTSFLVSIKAKPVIRYSDKSSLTYDLASKLSIMMEKLEKKKLLVQASTHPLIIIMDRKEDPVTPLLIPWTYQSMLHEEIGISNNKIKRGNTEIMLNVDQDDVFKEIIYQTLIDIGNTLSKKAKELQIEEQRLKVMNTNEEIKESLFGSTLYAKKKENITKHINLNSELSNAIKNKSYFDLSEIQQDLSTQQNHSFALSNVLKAVKNKTYSEIERIKLLILYNLRYEEEKGNPVANIAEDLIKSGFDPNLVRLISKTAAYAGTKKRTGDLFDNKNKVTLQKIRKTMFVKEEVESMYLLHKPLIEKILNLVSKSQLPEQDFPYIGTNNFYPSPKVIVIFVVGGITYE
eukprot:TRINITY_DN8552_c0_g1_i1.p1 TRINITY_DN8552_c0_g1~~TRINITY_DN8552_c0_g1_i1.p1  ORF type:complete len:502 (-),score=146.29 TRINITY_DN8552_c0_g1_i1:53-1558(-)